MSRDHGVAGEVQMVLVVHLDTTDWNAWNRPDVGDEPGATMSSTNGGAPFLVSQQLPVQPEYIVLGREVQDVRRRTRLGTSPNALRCALTPVSETDDQFKDIIRQSPVGDAELNGSPVGDCAIGVQ